MDKPRGRPGTRRRLDPSPIEEYIESLESAPAFTLDLLDRLLATMVADLNRPIRPVVFEGSMDYRFGKGPQ